MKQSILTILCCLLCAYLAFEVIRLKLAMHQLQANCAIAVLSAEAANRKVGAIAPFFAMDKEAFFRAYMDENNLPLAVFPDEVLNPIREILARARRSPEADRIRATVFK
jgi:hypothetical protein